MSTKKNRTKIILSILFILIIIPVCIYFFFPETAFKIVLKMERGIAGYDQKSIDVDGLHFEYLEGGHGDTLILLHGFGGNKDNWTRIGRYLTPYFHVIAPDLPGFGESSSNPDADYTVIAQIKRIHLFVQALGLTSFHLGGNSMGGYFAGVYAATYPDDVKSLLLLAPGGVLSAETSEVHQLIKAGHANPLIAENAEAYDRLIEFVFVEPPFIPRAIKEYLVQEAIEHQALNQKIYEQFQRSKDHVALEVTMKGLTIPTLIVWGKQDRVLHVSGADILKTVLPNSEVVLLEAVGHLPMVEKPDATAESYRRFLKK